MVTRKLVTLHMLALIEKIMKNIKYWTIAFAIYGILLLNGYIYLLAGELPSILWKWELFMVCLWSPVIIFALVMDYKSKKEIK